MLCTTIHFTIFVCITLHCYVLVDINTYMLLSPYCYLI